MKFLFFIATITLTTLSSSAQLIPLPAEEYKRKFDYAVLETNNAFPFVFTVIIEKLESGRIVSTETMVSERQDAGVERTNRTVVKDGQTSVSYQLSVGFGNLYCSADGVSWRGPQKYICFGPSILYGPRSVESAVYRVEEKMVDGQKVTIYQESLIYSPTGGNQDKGFKETIATIDSRGFFISVVNNEGVGDRITLVRRQNWDFATKIKPIIAPN